MIEFTVLIKIDALSRSVLHPKRIQAKTAKQAFTKARKLFPQWHASRIRIERVELQSMGG